MTLPKFSWLMRPFWQNTQPKLQPEKKMQPAPFFPLRTGSSHMCSIARATTIPAGIRHTPPDDFPVRSALQRRGQISQRISRPCPDR